MAEPTELTKKVKEFLKENYPYIAYVGTFKDLPTYQISDIPFKDYKFCIQGGPFYFVANPDDLSKSLIFAWNNFNFDYFKSDPDLKPYIDPMAEPVELTKKLEEYFKDSYPYINYVGRYKGQPAYEMSHKPLPPDDPFPPFDIEYCVPNPDDISKSKFFNWLDEDFLDNIKYAY